MTVLYDDIISGAQSRAIFATNQITLDEDNLFSFLNDIIRLEMVSTIDRVNQEFFVRPVVIPLESGISEYRIPYRAMGRTVREIKWYDSQSNQYRDMPLLKLEDVHLYGNYGTSSSYYGFYMMGDRMVLVPDVPTDVPSTYNIKVWYKLIPSYPCTASDSALVTSVSSPNVVVSSVPDNLSIGTQVDFIEGQAGCEIMEMDKTITNISGTTLTFAADDIPDDLAAGDWISLKQTSPVMNMIPDEAKGLVENRLAQLIVKSLGDEIGAQAIDPDIKNQMDAVLKMIAPRVVGAPQIIISRRNLTRGGRNWSNWFYGRVT